MRARSRGTGQTAVASQTHRASRITLLSAVLSVVCLLTYWNGLSAPFVYDDELSVVENRHIRRLWPLQEVLTAEQDSPTAGRPAVNVSLALNYAVSGLSVRAYHITNLAIHGLCALLVFGVMRRTLALPRVPSHCRLRSTSLSFATALLWLVHPLNSEVVEYLTQRTESMMALAYLATIYAGNRALNSRHPSRWHAVAVATCALGMACKESMVTAPLVVILYDRVYVYDSLGQALEKRWRFYGALAATWAVLAVLMASDPRGDSAGFTKAVDPWTYMLNQSVIITEYLRHAFWPQSLVAGYGWVQPLTIGQVLPNVLLIVALLVAAGVALALRPKVGFLAAWVFITLAPTSSFVPIPIEVGAERRMYLPLIALVALSVLGASSLWHRLAGARAKRGDDASAPRSTTYGQLALLVVTAAALALATTDRVRDYESQVSLYRTVVERWPTSLSHHILGSALMATGAHEEAVVHLRAAVPGAPRAHYDLGVELFNAGRLEEAIGQFETLIHIWESPPPFRAFVQAPVRGDIVAARLLLGRAFAQQRRWQEAAAEFERVVAMTPSHLEARQLLAAALSSARSYDQALVHYETYLKSRPKDVDALTNFAIALVAVGREEDAIVQFRRAVEAAPDDGRTRRNLANALFDHHDADEAAEHAALAVSLRPEDPAAIDLLGRVRATQGRFDEAASHFTRALELDPDFHEAREHLNQVRQLRPD